MEFQYDEEIQRAKKRFKKAQLRVLTGHRRRVKCLAWNSTGDILASGSVDGTIRLWSHVERKHAHKDAVEMRGHTGPVNAICNNKVTPDRLATTSSDKTVKIWDIRSGKAASSISLPGEGINIAWCPDGNTIACGVKGIDGMGVNESQKVKSTLIHIDTRKNTVAKKLVFFYIVNMMSWNASGTHFFLITGPGEIEVRTWPEFLHIRTIRAHTDSVCAIDMNPNGRNFAVGCADSLVSLWDITELACLRTFGHLNCMVQTIGISHDGQFIASGGQEDSFIDISHVESGENVATLNCEVAINELVWNPKQLLLAFDYHNSVKDNEVSTVRVFGF